MDAVLTYTYLLCKGKVKKKLFWGWTEVINDLKCLCGKLKCGFGANKRDI